MTRETHVTEELARRFLLGDLDEPERQRIERLLIVDSEVKQTILIAEEDLIEEYLDKELSRSDNEKFVAVYANAAPQRRKLEIAEAIRRRASGTLFEPRGTAPVKRFPNFLLSLWRRRTPLLIPATALAVFLVFAAIWFIGWNNRRLQERNRRNFIEQQLFQLNSPSALKTSPPQMLAVVLSPISTRGVREPVALKPETRGTIVEFRLVWIHESNYQNYIASIRRATGVEQFQVPNLRLEQTDRGNVIKLRASAEFFERGQYQITLSSFTKDGAPGAVEEYSFISSR